GVAVAERAQALGGLHRARALRAEGRDAELGRPAEAEPALREGYEIIAAALGAESARTMEAAERLRAFCDRHPASRHV
ncbi:MAG: hypothetical protein AAFQ36_14490, partial [Pseudomonadota bacterium]